MKLVLVEWLDSHSGKGGWTDRDRFSEVATPLYCRSVGWLMENRKDCKVIVPHVAGEKNGDIIIQGCGDLTIPTASITKVTVLRRR